MRRGDDIRYLSELARSGDVDVFKAALRDEASRIDTKRGKATLDEKLIYEAENLARHGLIDEAIQRIKL